MKEKLVKTSFVCLLLLIVLFAGVFTYLNVSYYGSVLKITLPFYSFALIIPIYSSFKNKIVKVRMAVFLYTTFLTLVCVFIYTLPQYTYDQASGNLEKKFNVKTSELTKKITDDESLFYKGRYKIKLGDQYYSYSLKNNIINEIEGK